MLGNLICELQKGKETWSAFLSDSEEAKKCVPLFNFQKRNFSYRKLCCLLFLQTAFIILSTQVTIYIAAHLWRQMQDVAYSNDLQQGGSYDCPSMWRLWFNSTAVSVGFLLRLAGILQDFSWLVMVPPANNDYDSFPCTAAWDNALV